MSRRRKKKAYRENEQVRAMVGVEAARLTPNAAPILYNVNDGDDVGSYTRETVLMSARALFHNSGRVRKAVEVICNLLGWLLPQPRSMDEAWNLEARKVFMERAMNADTFDTAGVLDFISAQLWMEECRCVDGDVLSVFAVNKNMPCVAFYRGSMVQDVEQNVHGRVLRYGLSADDGREWWCPAASCHLYRHRPDPINARGLSDLVAAIMAGRDLAEIEGYLKAALKITSQIALVETKQPDDPRSNTAGRFKKKVEEDGTQVSYGNANLVSLAAGRDVKVLTDNRPSPDARAFLDFLVAEIAHAVGLDPTVLYDSTQLGSAGTRFDLEKLRRWCEKRSRWRVAWCNKVWRHVIATELATGRLKLPKVGSWLDVQWIARRDMTIDLGRVSSAAINLAREGMASKEAWCLATEGRTQLDILDEAARTKAAQYAIEEKYGLCRGELTQGALGSTEVSGAISGTGDDKKDSEKHG